jgi:hypothetical protein
MRSTMIQTVTRFTLQVTMNHARGESEWPFDKHLTSAELAALIETFLDNRNDDATSFVFTVAIIEESR